MLRLNTQEIAGNLAEDAIIRSVSADRDALSLRVITNESWFDAQGNEQSRMCGHNVVKFGKKGQFNLFAEKYLQKGKPVFAIGTTEKKMSEPNADGIKFLNVTVNTSFSGDIQVPQASMRMNRQTIGGNLADDAIVRSAGEGRECLSFTVITNDSYQDKQGHTVETSCSHDVVQFRDAGQFANVIGMLKKGAGVYVQGTTEKENREHEGKKYLNVTVNASFETIQITKYVTEKPAQ